MVWEFIKLSDDGQSSVLNNLCDMLGDKGNTLNVPEDYCKVAKEEIEDYVEAKRELMRTLIWEASDLAAWVFVRKILDKYSVEQMIEEFRMPKILLLLWIQCLKKLRAVGNHEPEHSEEYD